MCLLNGLAKATGREMHLAAVSFRGIVTEPVLQKRGIEWGRAERIESRIVSVNHIIVANVASSPYL